MPSLTVSQTHSKGIKLSAIEMVDVGLTEQVSVMRGLLKRQTKPSSTKPWPKTRPAPHANPETFLTLI